VFRSNDLETGDFCLTLDIQLACAWCAALLRLGCMFRRSSLTANIGRHHAYRLCKRKSSATVTSNTRLSLAMIVVCVSRVESYLLKHAGGDDRWKTSLVLES
jgi:hypothetical protein